MRHPHQLGGQRPVSYTHLDVYKRQGRASTLVKSLLANDRLHEAEPLEPLPDNGGDDPDAVEGNLDAQAVQQIVYDALTSDQGPELVRVSTFEDEGIMTRDAGLVLVGADGTSWQLTIVQGRSR